MDSVDIQNLAQLSDVDTDTVNADEFAVIILAAGLSTRMGKANKILLKHNGQSFLQHSVSVAKTAGAGEILVVLGHDRDSAEREIDSIGVRSVFNAQYETGQMSSVHCGLSAISGEKKATLICLSDQPMLEALHLRKLMWAFENKPSDKEIVIPTYKNNRGNPVVISHTVRNRILEPGSNSGCRRYIDKHPELISWVSFNDEAYVLDVDTPDEYEALDGADFPHGTPQ